jgi:hypothetical protein
VIDAGWISGVFDRVVIERDPSGQARRATILDFKTDNVDEAGVADRAEHHRPQLETYRKVLCRLTGLPPGQVATKLVFTVPGAVVTVE